MGLTRTGTRRPCFCLQRFATHVRVRSQPIQIKTTSNSIKTYQKTELVEDGEAVYLGHGEKTGFELGRRIMVVANSSFEPKCALQWALSHTVQSQDTIVLLYVNKPSKQGKKSNREISPRVYEHIYSLKKMCYMKRPEVQVEVALVEGKDIGPVIVEEAKKQGVSLLVLGQRKCSMMWKLLMIWAKKRIGHGVVDYCIKNANCRQLQ